MKILWFAISPSLYDERIYGGWVASLERIIRNTDGIELAIAFEYESDKFKDNKDGVTYYLINSKKNIKDKIYNKTFKDYAWNKLKPKMLKIIEDFNPDIIQCFGSEWPFARISEYISIPVIIHMQGFVNIYKESSNIAFSYYERIRCNLTNPKLMISYLTNRKKDKYDCEAERYIMKINKFFLGRTNWDKMIVDYFSANSRYFYCPEALRPEIYNSKEKWDYKERNTKKLITITQAGMLKGNEIILRTAKLLKEVFNYKFIWEVAGNTNALKMAEKKTGIRHEDYNIKLIGIISPNEIVNKLVNSDIYIHPAIMDNSPNSLCEAQIIGCPVIAANVGGISSLIEDNKNGILYPYNEPYTLAFRIMNLCDDVVQMKKLSENEIEVAKKRHNPDEIKRIILKIYKEVLEEKNE